MPSRLKFLAPGHPRTKLPYYSETGADFVRTVCTRVRDGRVYVITEEQTNLKTARLMWYNGYRYLRDNFPAQCRALNAHTVRHKMYEDRLVFYSASSVALTTLLSHLGAFFCNQKQGDIFEVQDVELSVEEWSEVKAFLKKRKCTFDIDETYGKLLVIYEDNGTPAEHTEHREPERRRVAEIAGEVYTGRAPTSNREHERPAQTS